MAQVDEVERRRRKALDNFNRRRFFSTSENLLALSPLTSAMKAKAIQIISNTHRRPEADGEPA